MATAPLLHVSLSLTPEMRRRYGSEISRRGYRVQFVRGVDLVRQLGACRFLLTGRPPRIDWSTAERLELLQVAGTGVDPLFPAHGLSERVQIANLRGPHEDSVRDHVLGLLLGHVRRLPLALAQQSERNWAPYTSRPLTGQTLVLLGFGGIGRRVAAVARTLGMRVMAVRRSAAPDPDADRVYGPANLDSALSVADHVVVCLPLTSRTRGSVSAAMLARLPPHATLIDVSRGGIVDHAALEVALRSSALNAAALDVFQDEPLPASSSLWTCPNLIITPHVAGWTETYPIQVLESYLDNVERVERGQPVRSAVSREHEY